MTKLKSKEVSAEVTFNVVLALDGITGRKWGEYWRVSRTVSLRDGPPEIKLAGNVRAPQIDS